MYWLDPIAFQIGFVAVRWYGLAYLASFLICYGLAYYSAERRAIMSNSQLSDYLNYAVLGVVLGGRLGYVLFYHPEWVVNDPIRMVQVWKGGMAFHGGLIGYALATLMYCRYHGLKTLRLLDHCCRWIPIGLLIGRIANFINQELPGRITDSFWGVVFPKVDVFARHPSQLYEAFFEGIVLFVIMNLWARDKDGAPGSRSILFVMCYAIIRFFLEYFREPDLHLGFLSLGLTMGQWLCIIMFVSSFIFTFYKSIMHARN
jgi:phosphatidylglycerol---prolipoprotein diacylglyceryl transferase